MGNCQCDFRDNEDKDAVFETRQQQVEKYKAQGSRGGLNNNSGGQVEIHADHTDVQKFLSAEEQRQDKQNKELTFHSSENKVQNYPSSDPAVNESSKGRSDGKEQETNTNSQYYAQENEVIIERKEENENYDETEQEKVQEDEKQNINDNENERINEGNNEEEFNPANDNQVKTQEEDDEEEIVLSSAVNTFFKGKKQTESYKLQHPLKIHGKDAFEKGIQKKLKGIVNNQILNDLK